MGEGQMAANSILTSHSYDPDVVHTYIWRWLCVWWCARSAGARGAPSRSLVHWSFRRRERESVTHSLVRACILPVDVALSEKENVLAPFRTSIRLRPHNRAPLCDYASPQPCRLLSILIVVERVSDQERIRTGRGPENRVYRLRLISALFKIRYFFIGNFILILLRFFFLLFLYIIINYIIFLYIIINF